MMQRNDLTFGPLRPEHIDHMERIEVECFSVPWSREALEEELENPMAQYVVCCDPDGNVVGYIGSRQYRRQGIGYELVNRMLEEMILRGVSSVLLEVRESNLPAQNCYARAGFVPVGRRKNYYELPKEDALLMGRQLL